LERVAVAMMDVQGSKSGVSGGLELGLGLGLGLGLRLGSWFWTVLSLRFYFKERYPYYGAFVKLPSKLRGQELAPLAFPRWV